MNCKSKTSPLQGFLLRLYYLRPRHVAWAPRKQPGNNRHNSVNAAGNFSGFFFIFATCRPLRPEFAFAANYPPCFCKTPPHAAEEASVPAAVVVTNIFELLIITTAPPGLHKLVFGTIPTHTNHSPAALRCATSIYRGVIPAPLAKAPGIRCVNVGEGRAATFVGRHLPPVLLNAVIATTRLCNTSCVKSRNSIE